MSDGLGLAKGPDRFARGRLNRYHLSPRSRHGVEHAVDVDRSGPGEVVEVGSKIVTPPCPRDLKLGKVIAIDLVERRRACMAGIASKVPPLAILGPGQALGDCIGGWNDENGGGESKRKSLRSQGSIPCEIHHDVES